MRRRTFTRSSPAGNLELFRENLTGGAHCLGPCALLPLLTAEGGVDVRQEEVGERGGKHARQHRLLAAKLSRVDAPGVLLVEPRHLVEVIGQCVQSVALLGLEVVEPFLGVVVVEL